MPEKNQLYYGDNLEVLRQHVCDESVDLVYLDPPFNSRQDYNVLFAEKDGSRSSSQIHAFEDTWEWNFESQRAYQGIVETGGRVAQAMLAFHTFLGNSDMMAYLAMMAPRLIELRCVLKETGSIYLHCDPTASHYLKILMDAVFGPQMFRTEIIWKRTSSHGNVSASFGDVTDTILYYHRGNLPRWNQVFAPYSDDYLRSHFSQTDPDGRRFTTSDLRNPGVRPNLHYDYKGFKPHPNGWAVSRERMEQYDREDRLVFPKNPDGRIRLKRYLVYFHDNTKGDSKQILFSVKAGGVTVSQIRDLRGTLEREKAEIGVFLCFESPTRPMMKEAAEAGFYKSPDGTSYPRMQILTVQQLLNGQQVEYPRYARDYTFKQAPRSRRIEHDPPAGVVERRVRLGCPILCGLIAKGGSENPFAR